MKRAKKEKTKLYITTEQNGFDILTRNISRNKLLSDGAKSLYIYLNSHNENFNLSADSIADYLQKSKSTIQREIKELKENGFLILEKKENTNTYFYKLIANPKKDRLKDFSNEEIINAFFNNIIDLKDIISLYNKKIITLKRYKEITNKIFEIAHTKWANENE